MKNILKNKLAISSIAAFFLAIIIGAGIAQASPGDWQGTYRNSDDTDYVPFAIPTKATSTYSLLGGKMGADESSWYYIGKGLTVGATTTTPYPAYVISVDPGSLNILDITGAYDMFNTKEGTTSYSIDMGLVNDNLSSINSVMAEIKANLYGTSTSMYASAASTTSGLISKVDKTKLDSLSPATSRVISTTTRSIVTGTGATGFQVSATHDSDVKYSATIVSTATIAGGALGTIVLEYSPTNSSTSTLWSEIGRCTNGQSYSLAVALQGVNTQGCQVSGSIPAGYYVKIRSISTTGTPTFTLNSGQEVIW